ncbi:MAG: hypothetical protein ABR915_03030 [Thermoguttaceae bacterium]
MHTNLKGILARGLLAAIAMGLLGCSGITHAQTRESTADRVLVSKGENQIALANRNIEVRVDLKTGTYAIAAKGEPAARVEGARWGITDSDGVAILPAPGASYHAETRDISGALGPGKRLTISAVAPKDASALLEMELFQDKSFVSLNVGIDNRADKPIQLGQLHPIIATAFKGRNVAEKFMVLDGDTGCVPTRLRPDAQQVKCRNNLLAKFGQDPAHCLVIGGLTYHDFEKFARVERKADSIDFDCWSEDPVGRRVEPGERYLPDDKVYIDIAAHDPFEALEQYARAVKVAQQVEIPAFDFPTVCLWWASQVGPKANDTIGAVREMENIVKSGFLKYSRVGVRLLPDSYDKNNCDGWWDDEHWAKCAPTFAEPGPCYKPPYETTKKWCQAIIERGGVPIGYMRTNGRSDDYAKAFPGHFLFNDPSRQIKKPVGLRWWERGWPASQRNLVGYDFTDADFLKHMREVYANLKAAGLAGIFYDYPKLTGWCHEGGFEDPHATTAKAYRNIFALARDGLGKGAYTQERAYFLGSDVSVGLVASQRTIWDNTMWAPPVISRAGLRWYKNRVVMNYDTDGKQVLDEFRRNGRDGVRAMFTMTYVASARLLLANSFSQMTAEQLYDLSRVIPFHAAPQSARPLDLFSGGPYPRVYDFRVDHRWHQLTFYNTSVEKGEWPSIDVDLEPFTEGRRDFPPKVRALKPVASMVSVQLGATCAEGGLGLDRDTRYYVYDFWNDKWVGVYRGSDRLQQQLRPSEARMMSIHAVESHPQFLSTNRHVMQGYVDLAGRPRWDAERRELSGVSKVVGGETYKVVIATNGWRMQASSATGATTRTRMTNEADGLLELLLETTENRDVAWTVTFADGKGLSILPHN